MSITRRGFVKGSVAGAAALACGNVTRSVLGANSDIRVAVVGVRSRGVTHIEWASEVPGVKVVAICDADSKVLSDRAGRMAQDKQFKNSTVEQIKDFRTLLDRKDIDVISIATPNHWHALMAIMAMQAGKDVYVEKPVSHEIWEGRQIVNAARKYGKMCQTGTQSRSAQANFEIAAFLKAGSLGKINRVVATCYKPRGPIGKRTTPLEIPASVDYDMWCGPAEKRQLFRNQFHYDWHWDFNTGNGDIGNQGIHEMDRARWFLGETGLPRRVVCIGGRIGYDDVSDTANTQIACFDYESAPLIFEVRGLPKSAAMRAADDKPDGKGADEAEGGGKMSKKWTNGMDNYKGSRVGVVVECEQGYIVSGGYNSGNAYEKDGKKIKNFGGPMDHYGNFIKAVRSRKREDLNADIEVGHISTSLCHLANISYRLGAKMPAAEIGERIKANAPFAESFGRLTEHLKANEIKLDDKNLALGPMLEIDPKTERFVGFDEANSLLKRNYRKPFVVPDLSA